MNQLALDLRDEKARLSNHCATIVAWLEQGPCTNTDLSTVCLNYTARISELRKKKKEIRVISRERGGVVWYALFVNGKQVP